MARRQRLSVGVAVIASLMWGCGSLPSATVTPSPLNEPLLPIEQRVEMASISPETYLVECLPGGRKYPPGIRPSRPLGWPQTHPGYHILADGHCAFDPTAIAVPYSAAPVEGPP